MKNSQFNLTSIICLHTVKWLNIEGNLSGATTPVRVDLGAMAMKGYSTFFKARRL